jgi:hypothetical protein
MTQNYRDLQKSLKVDKKLNRISNFRLNQKKDVLEKEKAKVEKAISKELSKLKKGITSARNNKSVYNVKLNKHISIKDVIEATIVPKEKKLSAVLSYGGKHYTLNTNTRKRLLNQFGGDRNKLFTDQMDKNAGVTGSDGEIGFEFTGKLDSVNDLTIKYLDLTKKKKKEGAWFPYWNKTTFDLISLQIFNKDKFNYEENCFIYALKLWGTTTGNMTLEEVDTVKRMVKSDMIKQTDLKTISEKLNIGIHIKRVATDKTDDTFKTVNLKINCNKDKVIHLGLIAEHYFWNCDLPISLYSVKHYDEVKDLDDFQYITKMKSGKNPRPNRDRKVTTESFKIVNELIANKEECLEEIEYSDELLNSGAYTHVEQKVDYIREGNFNDGNFKKVEFKQAYDKGEQDVYYFDFETTTDGDKHVPYLCSWIKNDYEPVSKMGKWCGLDFLQSITKDSTIIVHNLGYDFTFLIPYLSCPECIRQSSSRVPSAKASFYNKQTGMTWKLSFKCSYTLTDLGLGKFKDVFALKDVKKDVMPYGAYNRDTVNHKEIGIEYAEKFFKKDDDKIEFRKNIKEWKLQTRKGYFNHIEYSKIYCEHDVMTTKRGFQIYRSWIKDVTGLDIMNYCTVASFADAYLIKKGCYNNCVSMSGTIREYLQGFVVGGRTMCSKNKKAYYKVNGKDKNGLSDFDACSLYPSAMDRLQRDLGGFLVGTPKILKDDQMNMKFLNKQDGYFVTVDIKKLGKNFNFPLLSQKNKDGIRMFENKTGIYKLCKIDLEDVMNFHQVNEEDIEILSGVYFDEGRNPIIGDTIRDLYQTRKTKKNEGNPIQVTYKLLMNSSYGKTCIKAHDTKKHFVNKDRIDTYMVENYNHIVSVTEVPDSPFNYVEEMVGIDDHYNRVHIGVEILAMSKRVMNEVMCLAEDCEIPIYYQDTDSMHIEADKIDLLSKEFNKKYDRELIGSEMGQFHSDFEFKSEKEIVATRSIFLGKKCYIDEVMLVKDGKEYNDYHIRMKGIPTDVVKYTAKRDNYMKLFRALFYKQSVKFDLLADEFKKRFVTDKNFNITTRGETKDDIFCRELSF